MNSNENYLEKKFNEIQKRDLLGLNLSGRGLAEIRSDTLNLKDNPKLDFIDLEKNNISKIESNAFQGQENLIWLYITENKLIETLFKRLSNLTILSIAKNNIKRIHPNLNQLIKL